MAQPIATNIIVTDTLKAHKANITQLDVVRRVDMGGCNIRMPQLSSTVALRAYNGSTNVVNFGYSTEPYLTLGSSTTYFDGRIDYSQQGTNNYTIRSNGGILLDIDRNNDGTTSSFVVRKNGSTDILTLDETSTMTVRADLDVASHTLNLDAGDTDPHTLTIGNTSLASDATANAILNCTSFLPATDGTGIGSSGAPWGSIFTNGSFAQSGTGTFTTGSGAVSLNGDTTLAANKNLTVSGTGAFTSGSGAVSLNGDTTLAANKNLTMSGTGTFATGTGAVSLNGDTTLAANKNLTVSGTGTFTTGTGAVGLNGATTVVSGKSLTLSGTATLTTGSGDISFGGAVVVGNSGSLTLSNFTSGHFVDVGAGGILTSTAKLTGFNLNVGTSSGTLAAGNHSHDTVYQSLENQRLSTTNDVSFNNLSIISNQLTVGGTSYSFPAATAVLVGESNSQNIGSKTLLTTCAFADPDDTSKTLGITLIGATNTKRMTISSSHTFDRTVAIPDADGTFCLIGATQTLTNKSLSTASCSFVSSTGNKSLAISTAGNSTDAITTLATQSSANNTINLPAGSADATLATIDTAQTFSAAKTFSTAPIISALTASTVLELDSDKNVIGAVKKSAYNVDFAGNGVADTAARSDHTHEFSGSFQPTEDQRLSTTNSPAFTGLSITGLASTTCLGVASNGALYQEGTIHPALFTIPNWNASANGIIQCLAVAAPNYFCVNFTQQMYLAGCIIYMNSQGISSSATSGTVSLFLRKNSYPTTSVFDLKVTSSSFLANVSNVPILINANFTLESNAAYFICVSNSVASNRTQSHSLHLLLK